MKIAIVSDSGLPPEQTGGIETNVITTGELLTTDGHQVEVFTPIRKRNTASFPFKVNPVKPHGSMWDGYLSGAVTYLVIYRRLLSALRDKITNDFDVIHCHNPFMSGMAGGKVAKERNIPSLMHFHFSHTGDYYLKEKRLSLIEWLAHFSLKLFDKISVNSNIMKKAVSARFGLEEKRIHVLPLFVDTDFFNPQVSCEWIRTKYEIPEGLPLILFLNRVEKLKGIDILLEAMALLRKNTRACILIVGGGSYLTNAQSLAQRLGIQDITRFTGRVPREHLSAICCAADIFVNPSLDECYSHVLLEAASCGRPIVSTKHPILDEEFALSDTNALTFPRGDSTALVGTILRLIQDPNLRTEMGRRARARAVEYHSLKAYKEGLLGIYQSLSSIRSANR